MREEEQLALNVYQKFYNQWGNNIFDNIAEQTHTDAVLALINTYGLTDPAFNMQGEYMNQELAASFMTHLLFRGLGVS